MIETDGEQLTEGQVGARKPDPALQDFEDRMRKSAGAPEGTPTPVAAIPAEDLIGFKSAPEPFGGASKSDLTGARRSQTLPVLPRTVPGGFTGISADLDSQGQDRGTMVRLLQQQALLMNAGEGERARLQKELARVGPLVRDTSSALEAALTATRAGDVSSKLSTLFTDNMNALNELESLSASLVANAWFVRSTWEQYAKAALAGLKMRSEAPGL